MKNGFKIQPLLPTKVIWRQGNVQNVEHLLNPRFCQAYVNSQTGCRLEHHGQTPSILVDFGRQIHGYLDISILGTTDRKPVRLRIRLGESVGEAMAELATASNATNDHSIRDQVVFVPWMGSFQTNHSGFRFARIDLVDPSQFIEINAIRAVCVSRDIDFVGRFESSDTRLNQIWQTGAYTVYLNMQEYLWDGIKRDRLVWIGDMHPETMVINTVFGQTDIVPRSLDLVRDTTPLPRWMNDISSYSLWWILIQYAWYFYQGDLSYLRQQADYLSGLLQMLFGCVDADGKECLPEWRFLDWPNSENKPAVHAGLHSLLLMAFDCSATLCQTLGLQQMAERCRQMADKMRRYRPDPNGSKSAAALLVLSGLADANAASAKLLAADGCRGFSTFYGYYILQALAKAGQLDKALELTQTYWGAMLDLGATTFWEDFHIDWLKDAARIDELTPPGKIDVHGTYGDYCYKGYRHSLCHGWAGGPTAWLSEQILGVRPLKPGFEQVLIKPYLGYLKFVDGAFPTPYGLIEVHCKKDSDGKIKTTYKAPKEVNVVLG